MGNTNKAAQWTAAIDELESSNQTIVKFAEANGINLATLNYWRVKLGRRRKRRPARTEFLEVVVTKPMREPSPIGLTLTPRGVELTVDGNTDLVLLRTLVTALC
jgi:hypothetical protein